MNNLISFPPYNMGEIAGLTFAVCKQLQIPCDGIKELGALNRLRDKINLISAKCKLKVFANNNLLTTGDAINQIALELVSQGVLDESTLKKDLGDFLSTLP